MAKQYDEYVDIFSDSSISELAENKKRKKSLKIKFAIISTAMLLICGSVAAAAVIHNFNIKPEESADTVISEPESTPVSKAETEVSKEESKEEVINFKSDAKFTKNPSLLSTQVKKALDNEIMSSYVVLYDTTTDQIIYERDSEKKCYPASTTKLMTAVVSSKYLKKNDLITVGDEIKLIGYDSSVANLKKGMKLTYEMLLDALLLPSGNDAAYTIAVATAKAYKQDDSLKNEECIKIFAELMNQAAKEMGCKGTHFTAPDGFHDDDHYVTASDMLRIATYAANTPIVMNSCKKYEAEWELPDPETKTESDEESEASVIDGTESSEENSDETLPAEDELPKEMIWYNSNQLLDKDGGQYSRYATGMKTGYTDEAGTCVVSSATMSNHTLIAVVMKSPSNYQKYHESNLLFTVGFNLFDLKYKHNDEWVN